MTQTTQRDTTRAPLSSTGALLPGRRVQLLGAAYEPGPTYGAIVNAVMSRLDAREGAYADDAGVWEYDVRLEAVDEHFGPRIDAVQPCYVLPVVELPAPLSGDAAAFRGALLWIARSRGQLHVLERASYNDAAYKVLTDGAVDLVGAIDAERRAQGPCQYAYVLDWQRGDELPVREVIGCAFHAEPGRTLCGVHGPIVERAGGRNGDASRGQATRFEAPVNAFDPYVLP